MENKEFEKILEDSSFTKGEAKVYLSLLETGESKVGNLIKSSGISRSKVYDILERLVKKGIISRIKKQGILYYQALPPQNILKIIKEKEEELKREEELLQRIIPQLSQIRRGEKVNIMVYEGFEGFKSMIDKTIEELKEGDIYDAMGVSETTEGMRHYAGKIYGAQKKKRFQARSIFDEKGAYKASERKTSLHEMRILPKGWNTPALFTVYNSTVGIHLGKEENIISIVIQNKDIAQSFHITFEAMWKIAKKI